MSGDQNPRSSLLHMIFLRNCFPASLLPRFLPCPGASDKQGILNWLLKWYGISSQGLLKNPATTGVRAAGCRPRIRRHYQHSLASFLASPALLGFAALMAYQPRHQRRVAKSNGALIKCCLASQAAGHLETEVGGKDLALGQNGR